MNRIVIALFLALLCHPGSADEPLKPVMLYISFSQSLDTDVPTPGKRRHPGLAVVNGSTVSFTPEAVSAHQVRAWRENSRHSEQFASVRVTPMLVNETVSLNVSGSETSSRLHDHLRAKVSGRLGEWMAQSDAEALGESTAPDLAADNILYVKVVQL